MPLKFTNPDTVAPPVAGYRHLAVIPPGRRMLVIAGQIGNFPDGSFADSVEAQFAQALANVVAIVASAAGTAADIARITCYLTETPKDFPRIGATMKAAFPGGPPAMTWIYVAGLFRPGIKAEIEAIAAVA
jgi:enamine deaminase RidA (YjgF/YER057c/UK114 family)